MWKSMRMALDYDPAAPKKATNVTINADLLRQAKLLGLNLSQTFEKHLEEVVREARRKKWLEENRDALDDHNDFIERHGVFSDGLRRF